MRSTLLSFFSHSFKAFTFGFSFFVVLLSNLLQDRALFSLRASRLISVVFGFVLLIPNFVTSQVMVLSCLYF